MFGCYRSPKNRKALQKVFSNDKPKLLGFVSKVRISETGSGDSPLASFDSRTGSHGAASAAMCTAVVS